MRYLQRNMGVNYQYHGDRALEIVRSKKSTFSFVQKIGTLALSVTPASFL